VIFTGYTYNNCEHYWCLIKQSFRSTTNRDVVLTKRCGNASKK